MAIIIDSESIKNNNILSSNFSAYNLSIPSVPFNMNNLSSLCPTGTQSWIFVPILLLGVRYSLNFLNISKKIL